MRLLGPKGNPKVCNLSAIIGFLREREEVHPRAQAVCQPRDIDCLSSFPTTLAEHVMELISEDSNT